MKKVRYILIIYLIIILSGCKGFSQAGKNAYVREITVGAGLVVIEKTSGDIFEFFKKCPKNVICLEKNRRIPAPGYDWIDRADSDNFKVKWNSSITHPQHSHIVASQDEGFWIPEIGYKWNTGFNKNERRDSENLEVKWFPDQDHNKLSNVVTSDQEGFWVPNPAYVWIDDSFEPMAKRDLSDVKYSLAIVKKKTLINEVTIDYSYSVNGKHGMLIRVNASINRLRNSELSFSAYFHNESGAELKALNNDYYSTPGGQLAASYTVIPTKNYQSNYDTPIFMPYDAFDSNYKNGDNLKFQVQVFEVLGSKRNFLGESEYYSFHFN